MNRFSSPATLLALSLLLQGCTPPAQVTADKTPRPVRAMVLSQPQSMELVSLPATLEPVEHAELAFRVAGPVQSVLVHQGQRVRKGEVLMQLDPHDFEVQIAEYQARLVEARAQAHQAKQERARVAAADRDDAIARVELDRANTAVERTAAAVTVVEQRLQMARDALGYSVLTAPFDAVVSRVAIEAHEQAVPAMGVLTLHGEAGFQVRLDLPEQLAHRVHIGMKAALQLKDHSGEFESEIAEISHSASMMSRTFQVIATLDHQPQGGWPEQTGLMTLALPSSQHPGFLLPSSAVQSRGEAAYVCVIDNGRVVKTQVEVVGYQRDRIRVQGQLHQGDVVMISGAPYFDHGAQVGDVLLGDRQVEL
ncbi:efflux RND transporter periplasmic adaptor subunit [Ferrimonas sp. YFM]|uniref:efflux RND transporter periplasmic adaptor subunit n=1 Tax=Ferrimonas sp. YFM TaxID=3028878 RepID=UPI0025734AC1|nr:efflux RND transporter periplasmic adaptor subunit [Ferrimonas sp. YFM]BDY05862.1 hemolysin D [Ferrimonas sp. YFM]